jgi:glucose-1-phosphate cytidylyltransferase
VLPYVGDEHFCFTYGDGLANLNIATLVDFHRRQGKLATVTAVQPPGRFGALDVDGERVREFEEKPRGDGAWTNGGFFVLSPEVVRYLDGDATVWEQEPMMSLARDGQLAAYRHNGFWQAMDTLRERNHLEELWTSGRAPWRVWE